MFTKAGVIAQTHKSGAYVVSDSDAIAFLSATSITDATISQAIDQLVIAAKANGWWTLCDIIYPFVGGIATTHKYNLKDPQNTDAAFRLTFGGSFTHSSTGALPDGSSANADTHLTPSSTLTYNNTHFSFYSRTNSADTGAEIGVQGNSTQRNRLILQLRYATDIMYSDHYSAVGAAEYSVSNSDSRGLFISSRVANNDLQVYKNGTSLGTNTTVDGSDALPSDRTVYMFVINNDGILGNYSVRECAFATIGDSISSALAATMYTDIQAFQTTLGRQV